MTNRYDFDSIERMETIQTSFDHLIRENPMGEARKGAQRQAHQDRSQSGPPFALRDISNGRSGCSADTLPRNTWPDQAVAFFDNTREAGMMCGTAENRVLEWRGTA